ncbi:type IV toxin-antitoxin system AbiEi family antitoxin domain-containing protein [Sinomonas sp. ASV486]|uniref:type IV toxin-antitoxin system AbiEi family antitoxin domain-containing protein n=1 Tax=Sinomonas sp. ASV486 TaxID=3051170 RepID=UPI0027DDF11A|nr:type IV toxin-antitoxin system AbiEi family antitoxin domain-containing protein [Sinomonas sp. ASV486]MDQ4492393.1 type IV toxin-antitoxin system AbiEi family antitoxin domain-containing protein [Sinomonas sp. ASV486]
MRFPHATFTSSFAALTGRTPRQLARAYAAGRLVRLRRGVYMDIDEWFSGTAADRYAMTTASLAVGGNAPILCRETALMAWGLELPTVPDSVRYRTDRPSAVGAVPARRLYGDPDDARRRWGERPGGRPGQIPQGFPDVKHLGITSGVEPLFLPHLNLTLPLEPFDPAFVDTVPRLSFAEGVVLADSVLARRPDLKVSRTLDDLRRLCTGMLNRSAQTRMTHVLDCASGASESVGESLGRALMWELGFEIPQLQYWVTRDGRRIARVDYFWPGIRLAGEFDGLQKYLRSQELSGKTAAQVVVDEKRREDEIRATGVRMVRWVWADILEPARLATILHRAGVPRRSAGRAPVA